MEGSGPKKGVCISEERAIAPRKLVCQDRDVTGSANLVAIKVIFPTLYGEGGIGTVNASRDGLRTAMHVPPMGERTANVFAIVLFRWGVWE